MQVGKIVIGGNVENSTIITGSVSTPTTNWIYNPLTERWIAFINHMKCEIWFDEPSLKYKFEIMQRGVIVAFGSCGVFERTKNMVKGFFDDVV